MEGNYYKHFDYFCTSTGCIIHNKEKMEEYGLDSNAVSEYIRIMTSDRNKWQKKRQSYFGLLFCLQCILSVLIFALVIYLFWDLNRSTFVEKYNKYVLCAIFALGFPIIFALEWVLWHYEIVFKMYHLWVDRKYKIRTQQNPTIEKYLEDCHWEWNKREMEEIQRRRIERIQKRKNNETNQRRI